MGVKICLLAAAAGLLLVGQTRFLAAEAIRLRSGKEVSIVDGRLPAKAAEELFAEAEDLVKKGQLDFAGEYWKLVIDKGTGDLVRRATAARGKIKEIEYGSRVILKDGEVLEGKVSANLRADLLGLEGKEVIPIWRVEWIVAEYHPGYSFVSKTFYPLIVLEIKLRGRELQISRIAGEIEFVVEAADGPVNKALLGIPYQLLRSQDLAKQLDSLTSGRISKVVIYPELKGP